MSEISRSDVLDEYIEDLVRGVGEQGDLLDALERGDDVSGYAEELYRRTSQISKDTADELLVMLGLSIRRREIERWIAALPDQEPEWEFPFYGTPEQPLQINGVTGTPNLHSVGDGDQLLTVDVVDSMGVSMRQVMLFAGEAALLRWKSEPGEQSPQYVMLGADNGVAAQHLSGV